MFHRLILEDSATLFTLAAFIVAASIFVTFVWRAIRMSRRQCEHFERLPFETPTPACGSGFRVLHSSKSDGGTPDSSAANARSSGINPDPQSDESR